MSLQIPYSSIRISQEKGKKFHPQRVGGLAKFMDFKVATMSEIEFQVE